MGTAMERAHAYLQVVISFALLFVATALFDNESRAQEATGEPLVNSLRGNVVRIVARWTDGSSEQTGYGFVVSQTSEYIYIVTADHVVRNSFSQGQVSIGLYFF